MNYSNPLLFWIKKDYWLGIIKMKFVNLSHGKHVNRSGSNGRAVIYSWLKVN